jgi:predicted double-glycine peptidase
LPVVPVDSAFSSAPAAPLQISTSTTLGIPDVPFFSQFKDISSAKWKKVGCGIADLAMVIDYYKPGTVSPEALLKQGVQAGAYSSAGWTYAGLVRVANNYGLDGGWYDLAASGSQPALAQLKASVGGGPVIASVHYKFDPKSPVPHLVVVTAIRDGLVYYNDPAAGEGGKSISQESFLSAWKKRFIVIRPVEAALKAQPRGV